MLINIKITVFEIKTSVAPREKKKNHTLCVCFLMLVKTLPNIFVCFLVEKMEYTRMNLSLRIHDANKLH